MWSSDLARGAPRRLSLRTDKEYSSVLGKLVLDGSWGEIV